ncbi:MAG: CHAT domain-containing protein [Chloroflexota bacterium]
MVNSADLEICLRRWSTGSYAINLRYTTPQDDVILFDLPETEVALDFNHLREIMASSVNYGRFLTKSLFAHEDVQRVFIEARHHADAHRLTLRLRLFIHPSAPELHSVRWETLRRLEEDNDLPLISSDNLYFSRYLSSYDWRPVRTRRRGSITALVAVASPPDIEKYTVTRSPLDLPDAVPGSVAGREANLTPINVGEEVSRAQAAFSDLRVEVLQAEGRVTLNGLVERLRDGFDVLYLVCHGALVNGQPYLYLEQDGRTQRCSGAELVTRISELEYRPRLVVLGSCQSAGTGDLDLATSDDEGVLSALGPRLAEIGIPAVIAMQGNVTMTTARTFLEAFGRELRRHGIVDRAVAAARQAVAGARDDWMPVLFMRLKGGRVWPSPEDHPAFEHWDTVGLYIRNRMCTPLLGPGVAEHIFGVREELAERWAALKRMPIAPHDRSDLARVAQYRSVREAASVPEAVYRDDLRQKLQRDFRNDLSTDQLSPRASVSVLASAIGALLRQRDPNEPHRVLASLRLPIYITANPDNLLTDALREAGADPVVRGCPWKRGLDARPLFQDLEEGYEPSPERPLVFHLFGSLDVPGSLVMTEDDYFDFLIAVHHVKHAVPFCLRSALADTALLVMGFQLQDWSFRVLFRSLSSAEGSDLLGSHPHVAVQIAPEDSQIADLERAERYLEKTFTRGNQISLYWGTLDEFSRALREQVGEGDA